MLFGIIFSSFALVIVGLNVYKVETKQARYKTCIKDAVSVIRLFPTSILTIPQDTAAINRFNIVFSEYLHSVDNYCHNTD